MELREGIVLKSIDYQEYSKIIYILTKTGIISVIAKNANNYKSHNYAYSQVMTHIAFGSSKDKYLSSGKVLNAYTNLHSNYNQMICALKILEMSYVLGSHINDYEVFYDFLVDTLSLLDTKTNPQFWELIFKIKTLYLLGIAPIFTYCVSCKKTTNIKGFAFNNGGMKCVDCAENDDFFYPTDIIAYVKRIYITKLNNLLELNDAEIATITHNYNRIDRFLELYYEQYMGFKSKVTAMEIK